MLQSFRDNLKGTVATFLVLLVSVPFIFFGVDSLFTGGDQTGKAAEVNGDVVSETQLRRAVSQQRDQLTQRFGDQLPADFLSDERLRGPALDELISRQLRIQGAQDGRMTVSDAALDELIVSAPLFQVDGKFNAQRFTYTVQSMGYTPAGYREMIRQEIIAQQYINAVAATGFVTDAQLAQFVKLAEQSRDFYYVTLPLAPALAAVSVSAEEVDAYYQANQAQFQVAEQIGVDTLELNVADLAAQVEISDEQVAAQYEQNMQSFEAAPVRQAAHILIEAENLAAAQQKLDEVRAALDAGEDFGALAARFSDDLGTRDNGGDLGFTSGDTFPEEFESALAALTVGQVSEPVQTDAGFHLIKLVAVDQAEKPSLEEEAPMIRMALADAQAQQLFVEKLERLKEEAYNTDSLQEVADSLQLPLVQLPAMGRAGGQGLAADPKVVQAAFSDEVLKDGHISPVLELSETSVVVVSKREYIPATVKSLAEVADLIETQLKDQKARAQLSERGAQLLAELSTGADVEAAATAAGFEWQVSYGVKRSDSRYDPAVLRQLFDMKMVDQQPAYDQVNNQSGDLVLLKLAKIIPGDLTTLSAEQRKALAQRLNYETAAAELLAFDAELKQAAEITVY